MTSLKPIDSSEHTSVTEIFSHPLPQIRQIHRGLTAELEEKNARLRALVGGNYRQLLGTADTIVMMSKLIHEVEENLARISQACRKSTIDDLAKGLGKLHEYENREKHREQLEWQVKLKATDIQVMTIEKLLRENESYEENQIRGKSLIVTVKILVITSLLIKSLQELARRKGQNYQRIVLEMKKKLSSLRCRSFGMIERVLKRVVTYNRHVTIQALIAYSLITNSGMLDTLKYFLSLRNDFIVNCFTESYLDMSTNIMNALISYVQTLFNTPLIFPHGLSENMANLKLEPILKDKTIRNVEELRLDEFESWFSDDVKSYTPFLSEGDLKESLTAHLLKEWATNVLRVLLEGISKSINRLSNLADVINLRTQIYDTCIKEERKITNFNFETFLRETREIVNSRLLEIIQQRCQKVCSFDEEIKKAIESWETCAIDMQKSLWDQSILEMDVDNGVDQIKKIIVARTCGRNDALNKFFSLYQTWRESIHEILLIIDQMKKQKWFSDIEELDDTLSLTLGVDTLNREDPELLQRHVQLGFKLGFQNLQRKIQSMIAQYETCANSDEISAYILRIIRDIRSDLPQSDEVKDFGSALFDCLYERLAGGIIGDYITIFIKAFEKNKVTGRVLWKGDPELAVQPSPAAFKLLYNLTTAMAKSGHDLWNPRAIFILKKMLLVELTNKWCENLKKKFVIRDKFNNLEIEEKEDNESTESVKELIIQAFFDFSFIVENALKHHDTESQSLIKDLEALMKSVGEIDIATEERISENASKYWKKTHLLFSIIA